jgi:hypothetical protein
VLLDGMVIAASLFGLTWLVSIDVLVTGPGGPWLWERVIAGFYPLGDVVNLSIAVTALAHARKRALASFGLITAGIALIGGSDLGFLYLTQHDAYASGGSVDLGWCVGFFLVGFAALHRPTVPERPRGAAAASQLRVVLPVLSMGALVSAVGLLAATGRGVDRELLVGTTCVVLLSIGRHGACLRENARMQRQLQARVDAEPPPGTRRDPGPGPAHGPPRRTCPRPSAHRSARGSRSAAAEALRVADRRGRDLVQRGADLGRQLDVLAEQRAAQLRRRPGARPGRRRRRPVAGPGEGDLERLAAEAVGGGDDGVHHAPRRRAQVRGDERRTGAATRRASRPASRCGTCR